MKTKRTYLAPVAAASRFFLRDIADDGTKRTAEYENILLQKKLIIS